MSSVSADIRKRLPVSNPRARSKANTDKPSDSDSDGSVEEVVRHPTFYEQLASQHASSSGGMPNIQKIKIPLKQKLAKDELIQDFTVEEIDVDDHNQVEDEEGATIGDAGQAFFFAIPLLFVLILFDILIYIQYREDVDRGEVVLRAFKSFLPIWFMVYTTHPRRHWRTIQFGLFVAAVSAGCFLVYSVNVNGFFAVMQRAPPLGTVMLWCVVEMELLPAVATCAVIGGYTWWKEFSLT